MWRNVASRRFGVITTPAKCVSCDRSERRRAHELLRPVGGELALEPMDLDLLERLHHHQAVDEEPVALRRRDASGRRVRARDVAQLLEVRHHVADRRRRQLEARLLRQHARADRLAFDDVALDERSSAGLGARIQHAGYFTGTPTRPLRRPDGRPDDRPVGTSMPFVGYGARQRLCFNRGDGYRPPRRRRLRAAAFPPGGAHRAPREPGHRGAAVASRGVSRRAAATTSSIEADTARSTPHRRLPDRAAPKRSARAPTSRSSSAATARCCRSRGGSRRSTCRSSASTRAASASSPTFRSRAWRRRSTRCSRAATSRSAARCSRPRSCARTARARPRSR